MKGTHAGCGGVGLGDEGLDGVARGDEGRRTPDRGQEYDPGGALDGADENHDEEKRVLHLDPARRCPDLGHRVLGCKTAEHWGVLGRVLHRVGGHVKV